LTILFNFRADFYNCANTSQSLLIVQEGLANFYNQKWLSNFKLFSLIKNCQDSLAFRNSDLD